jgi:hypothetical protein
LFDFRCLGAFLLAAAAFAKSLSNAESVAVGPLSLEHPATKGTHAAKITNQATHLIG